MTQEPAYNDRVVSISEAIDEFLTAYRDGRAVSIEEFIRSMQEHEKELDHYLPLAMKLEKAASLNSRTAQD